MNSSVVVTLATCLIIAAIVTQSASALAFQGSQDRAKRLFWVDKKSANDDNTFCVRASAAEDIVECYITNCIKKQFKCQVNCARGMNCEPNMCNAEKLDCSETCLRSHASLDV